MNKPTIFIKISILILLSWSAPILAKEPVLVDVNWLSKQLNKPNHNIVLIDLSEQSQYQKFHLPNAIHINYNWLIKSQDGIALSGGKKHMVKLLSKLGVSEKDYIVIYDNEGNLKASRLYWELAKLNHQKVSMLDGGSIAWVLAGQPVTQNQTPRKPAQYVANKINREDALTANKKEVFAAIKDPKSILLDTRSKQEYLGNPKDKTRPQGHIPSALFFPWEVSVDGGNGYRQRDNKKLSEFFNYLNMQDKNAPIIAYCNSGHRAARVFTLLKSSGFQNVKLYDASMQEWGLSKENPLKLGKNP